MSYKIITDSSCDLPMEMLDEMDVTVVPLYVTFDGVEYKKEKVEQNIDDFYKRMVENKKEFPKSSLPSIQDYVDVFTEYASKGQDIICICITTKFSGSYNSAKNAAGILEESYPNIKITVIDSKVNTVLQGILVKEVVRLKESGASYEKAIEVIETMKETGRIIFTVGSLDYLKKGGRIGKVLLGVVSAIGVKPLIILKEGEIFAGGITRNRAKSLKMVCDGVRKHFEDSKEDPRDYEFCIGYGYDIEEAKEFKKMLLESEGEYLGLTDINIYQIGAAIATHTGPHPLGVALVKKFDRL